MLGPIGRRAVTFGKSGGRSFFAEILQYLRHPLFPHLELLSDLFGFEGTRRFLQDLQEAPPQDIVVEFDRFDVLPCDPQAGCAGTVWGRHEFDRKGAERSGGPVFGRDRDPVAVPLQADVRIDPGVEVGRAAEVVAGSCSAYAFADMVDNQDRRSGRSLQLPEIAEQRGHRPRLVFVLRMKAHERIQDEERWVVERDGLAEPLLVLRVIQWKSGVGPKEKQ